jgi:predicted TIM-barrel fold metal-dependent hydrolase
MTGSPPPSSAPRHKAPPRSADCHFHIFGARNRYALSAGHAYLPPEAPVEAYLNVAATLGVERMVIVNPAFTAPTTHALSIPWGCWDNIGREPLP